MATGATAASWAAPLDCSGNPNPFLLKLDDSEDTNLPPKQPTGAGKLLVKPLLRILAGQHHLSWGPPASQGMAGADGNPQ